MVTDFEFQARRRDGTKTWISMNVRGVKGPDGELGMLEGMMEDINDRKGVEEALRSMSLIDDLTGLYNRRGFMTLARQELKRAYRAGAIGMLLYADLDNMKWINDNMGHVAGDAALNQVAQILRQTFRESDIVARIGGDEFVVFALETPDAQVDQLVGRLTRNLEGNSVEQTGPLNLSVSVGLSRYDPSHPSTVEELLDQADVLMYESKRKRKKQQSISGNSVSGGVT
jgi:diguanylate cyclase (GGDEF)-like protein